MQLVTQDSSTQACSLFWPATLTYLHPPQKSWGKKYLLKHYLLVYLLVTLVDCPRIYHASISLSERYVN